MARPMKSGRPSGPDRSFSRSPGGAALRGGLLLAVALVLGVVLLNASDDAPNVPSGVTIPGGVTETTVPDPSASIAVDPNAVPATAVPLPVIRSAANVKVLVANGSAIGGAAAAGTEKVREGGYTMLTPVDAAPKPQTTAVLFVAGYEAEASDIATRLLIPTTAVSVLPPVLPVADLGGANILVMVGTEMAQTLTATTVAPPA